MFRTRYEEQESTCLCETAGDLGFTGWGDGVNPNMIAYVHPECPIHGDEDSE